MKKRIISLLLVLVLVFACVPVNVLAVGTADATVSIENVTAVAGATVDVNVKISNNPGIAGATFTLAYHKDLTLIKATSGSAFSGLDFTQPGTFTNPCNFTWDSENVEAKNDGVLLTLTFQIADTAKKNSKLNVDVSYRYGDIFSNEKDLNLDITNGNIIVIDYLPGDVYEDGVINSKDTRLIRQYIAGGYNITINEAAADVNDDGVINSKDTRLIRRFIAGGYDVELLPSTPRCKHSNMTSTAKKDATCTKDGNTAYWYCKDCEKYFADKDGNSETTLEKTVIKAGHSLTHVEAKAATAEEEGCKEHWKCSICGKYFLNSSATTPVSKDDVVIAKLVKDESTIIYNLYGADTYLASIGVNNPNPEKFVSEKGLALSDITGPDGYTFAGWQDSSGKTVTEILPGLSRTINLTATWRLTEYSVDFLPTSQEPEEINAMPTADVKYTTNNGLTQGELNKYTPTIPGYRFLGWSNESGTLIKEIPQGTTGLITLYANWASEWNRAEAIKPSEYKDPLVYEENGKYMFAYHIGEIKNVVLDVLTEKSYQYTPGGPTQKVTITSSETIGKTEANAIANTIAEATTKSSTWSLSKDWNTYSSVSRAHTEQSSEYCDKVDSSIKSGSSAVSISSDSGGTSKNTVDWGINAKLYGKNTTEIGASVKVPIKCVDLGVNAKNTTELGGEISGSYQNTTVNTGYWNTASSYDASSAYTNSSSISSGYSKAVCDNYQIDNSYSQGGSSSKQESVAVANTQSKEYTSSFSYVTEATETVTKEVTWDNSTDGWWRYVRTGNIAVIATVIYDTKTSTYSVYTQGILRDGTQSEGWQKSMEDGAFNDHQNYVIPFEVPVYVHDYINNAIGYSNGLDVDIETGIVKGYANGNPKTDVHLHIPDYFTQSNDDGTYSGDTYNNDGTYLVTKITGIAPGAFKDCTNIKSVRLGKYVTEISDNAFNGCTSLKEIDSSELTAIGSNAFANCTSLENYVVGTSVASLGTGAFSGAKSVMINASTPSVAAKAVNSGAKALTVNLNSMSGNLANKVLLIANATEAFTLNGRDKDGNAKTYSNVRIESNAAKDITLNGMHFTDNSGVVLKLTAEKLTLNGVNIDATDKIAIVLKADNTNIALQGKVTVATTGTCAILGKNISLSRVPTSNITTYLRVNSGNVYSCGAVTDGNNYLQQSNGTKMTETTTQKIVIIGEDAYRQLVNDTLEWVLASEAPAGATIVNRKYSYSLRSYTENSASSLSGWTKYDTKRTSWGATQGPVYSDPSNGARNVWSEQYVASQTTHYVYYHRYKNNNWSDDAHASSWARHAGPDVTYQLPNGYYSSTTGQRYSGEACSVCKATNQWHLDRTYTVDNYATRWYYQEPVYTYYYYKDTEKESSTYPSGDNISNIQEWVQYVAK